MSIPYVQALNLGNRFDARFASSSLSFLYSKAFAKCWLIVRVCRLFVSESESESMTDVLTRMRQ
jgi:hypothetical protein